MLRIKALMNTDGDGCFDGSFVGNRGFDRYEH